MGSPVYGSITTAPAHLPGLSQFPCPDNTGLVPCPDHSGLVAGVVGALMMLAAAALLNTLLARSKEPPDGYAFAVYLCSPGCGGASLNWGLGQNQTGI